MTNVHSKPKTSSEGDVAIANLIGAEKMYGEVHALRGIDLEIRRGEILALLGPNGAGKTTAISLWLGLVKPDAGEVNLFGGSPYDVSIRVRIGVMLQQSGVNQTLKVEELIDLFRSYYPRPASIDSLVQTADLGELMGRRASELSGGQRQRLMFGLALAGDPELIFLDEPTVGLDVTSRRQLWTTVRRLTEEGRTVLLTTHHLEEADALADRVIVIDHGRKIAEGTPQELADQVSDRIIRCVTSIPKQQLMSFEGVRGVEMQGAITEVLTTRTEGVLRQMFATDPGLRDLEVKGIGLEQAFLTLTNETNPKKEVVA